MDRGTVSGEITIMKVDSEGDPIPETAQKLGNIEHVDISAEEENYMSEDTNIVAISPQELEDSTLISGWTEMICAEAAEEEKVNKQHHYDETHSRKSNWHKRYF